MKEETLAQTRERHARQVASRVVTRKPDDRCTLDAAGAPLDHAEKCDWCRTKAPRPAHLLVNVPTKLAKPVTMEYMRRLAL